MSKTRILSIDGGGIRGIIPAFVLAEIEDRTGRRCAEMFDIIAGTSTGGILACGLARPDRQWAAEDIISLYEDEGPRIFSRSAGEAIGSLWGLSDQTYPSDGLRSVMREYIGKAPLSETTTDVVATTYELRGRSPLPLTTAEAKEVEPLNLPLWEVACATACAPTYFEPHSVDGGRLSMIDGGVYAGNPVMEAIAYARGQGVSTDEMVVVSLGTGQTYSPIQHEYAKDWGLLKWAAEVVSICMDGAQDAAHSWANAALERGKYFRLQRTLEHANGAMDDASETHLQALRAEAAKLVQEQGGVIREIVEAVG